MIDEKVEKDNIAILTRVPVLYADRPGRNLNVYEEDEIIKGLNYFNNASQLDRTIRYIYIRHTNDEIGEKETLQLVAGWIDRLYYDRPNKALYADIRLLPTTWGKLVKWLVKHNYPVGTSIRGAGIPVEKTIEWNGKQLKVKSRKNFKLKGFDFVVEPSFITTQIAGEHYIKEQTNNSSKLKDQIIELIAKEENLTDEEKCDLDNFCSLSCNKDISISEQTKNQDFNIQGGIKMENLEKERLELEIEKLSIQKSKIEEQIASLKSELEKLETNKNSRIEELDKIKDKIKGLIVLKSELENEINSFKSELENVKSEIEGIRKEKEELQETVKVLEQAMEEDKVTVRRFGKVFSEDNPPKVRIVDPVERILTTEWGTVNKDNLRKIAYLAYRGGNKEVKKAFGLITNEDDWRQWKYPVCQFVKSEDENYDFDYVLNLNGLKTAYIFMTGRPGMALSYKEKKELAKNLLYWYKKAKEAGRIEEIPEGLTKVAEGTIILTEEDEVIDSILETLQQKGFINIEIPEEVKEQSNENSALTVDSEDILVNVSKAVADALLGKVYAFNEDLDRVVEQVINSDEDLNIEQELERFFQIVIENSGFESKEEVEQYLKEAINSEAVSDLLLTLKPIVSMVVAKLSEEGIEPDRATNYAFNILSILSAKYEDENMNVETEPQNSEENNTGNEEMKENTDKDNALYEQTNINNDENIDLDKSNLTEEELEMEKLKAIIALINDKYDLDTEVNVDNIVDVLTSIFNKHVETEEKVEELKRQVEELLNKVEELSKSNFEEKNNTEAQNDIESEEVKEQADRKGTVNVKEQIVKKEEDLFIKLMRNI